MDSLFYTTTPALKGRVKQRYSDFIVEEVLTDGTVCAVQKFTKPWEQRTEVPLVVPPNKNEEHLHLDLENGLHRVANVSLGGVRPDPEAERPLIVLARLGLFRDQRALNHVEPVHRNASESFCAVLWERTTRSCSKR